MFLQQIIREAGASPSPSLLIFKKDLKFDFRQYFTLCYQSNDTVEIVLYL